MSIFSYFFSLPEEWCYRLNCVPPKGIKVLTLNTYESRYYLEIRVFADD